jgi:hypothetical protein
LRQHPEDVGEVVIARRSRDDGNPASLTQTAMSSGDRAEIPAVAMKISW